MNLPILCGLSCAGYQAGSTHETNVRIFAFAIMTSFQMILEPHRNQSNEYVSAADDGYSCCVLSTHVQRKLHLLPRPATPPFHGPSSTRPYYTHPTTTHTPCAANTTHHHRHTTTATTATTSQHQPLHHCRERLWSGGKP